MLVEATQPAELDHGRSRHAKDPEELVDVHERDVAEVLAGRGPARVEKKTRTKSSQTSACGDWANSTQPIGQRGLGGVEHLPSFRHFIAAPPVTSDATVELGQPEAVPSDLVAEVEHVTSPVQLEDVRVAHHLRVPAIRRRRRCPLASRRASSSRGRRTTRSRCDSPCPCRGSPAVPVAEEHVVATVEADDVGARLRLVLARARLSIRSRALLQSTRHRRWPCGSCRRAQAGRPPSSTLRPATYHRCQRSAESPDLRAAQRTARRRPDSTGPGAELAKYAPPSRLRRAPDRHVERAPTRSASTRRSRPPPRRRHG